GRGRARHQPVLGRHGHARIQARPPAGQGRAKGAGHLRTVLPGHGSAGRHTAGRARPGIRLPDERTGPGTPDDRRALRRGAGGRAGLDHRLHQGAARLRQGADRQPAYPLQAGRHQGPGRRHPRLRGRLHRALHGRRAGCRRRGHGEALGDRSHARHRRPDAVLRRLRLHARIPHRAGLYRRAPQPHLRRVLGDHARTHRAIPVGACRHNQGRELSMTKHLSGSVAIVGAAESDLGKVPGLSALELQGQAAQRALRDAGLTLRDVDGVFAHTDDRFSGLQVAEYLGVRPRYVDSTNVGGMSNVLHIRHAMAAIQAGMCDVALITYGRTQLSDGSRKLGVTAEDARSPRGQFITPYGQLSPIGYYAMVARLHMHRYGTTPQALAEVAVAARRWAMLNPKAYKRDPLTIDDVLASAYIAEPLRQRDCCLVTDAGGALVVTAAERARDLARPPVYVRGIAEAFSHHYT